VAVPQVGLNLKGLVVLSSWTQVVAVVRLRTFDAKPILSWPPRPPRFRGRETINISRHPGGLQLWFGLEKASFSALCLEDGNSFGLQVLPIRGWIWPQKGSHVSE